MTEEEIKIVNRGYEAKKILESLLIQDYFKQTKDALVADWQNCKDKEKKETFWLEMQLLSKFEKNLTFYIEEGKLKAEGRKKILGII